MATRKTAKRVTKKPAKRKPTKPRDINADGYQALLAKLGACSEARHADDGKSLRQVWNSCDRGGWLLWLADKLDIDRKLIVLAACDCARTALKFVPADESRPLRAIETAEAWCRGEAAIEQVNAAYAAANAAYAAIAADAAASEAANAAYAAYAAAENQCADLVRARIPFDLILAAAKAAGE